jgi:fucose permease
MLGAALFAVPVGLVLGAAVAERLVDRVGSARAAWAAGTALGVLTLVPGAADTLPELMAALLAMGAAGGMMDVAQNAQGVRLESAYGRPVMTSLHACFSLGAIAGSLAGGGFAWAGVGALPSLAALGLAGALIVAVAGRWFLPGTSHEPSPAARAAGPSRLDKAERHRVRRLVVALGVLAICGMVGEGAAGDWSAVYLQDNLGTSAGFAALGFAAFSATMTGGRLAGDRLVARFGAAGVTRACGVTAAIGLGGALATTSPQATIAGFAVFGAGLSIVVPQAFLAGGRADPERPGSGLARVVGLGYAGLSAGPAVIGAVASRAGLRIALLIPLALALWIIVAAPAIAKSALAASPKSLRNFPLRPQARPSAPRPLRPRCEPRRHPAPLGTPPLTGPNAHLGRQEVTRMRVWARWGEGAQ